ncbi:MAG: tetraacyldisaccharide 4'-kinase [Holosporaceae bacterium]|jgi:tetraacyldisaccharide 4'-kinase|nr:tetraacyldisaccharide 4'-kinase [Holosporaceae bacterium]
MDLKAPKFWYEDVENIGFCGRLFLYPISRIYAFLSNCNYGIPGGRQIQNAKVIAVGGVTVGGSGKSIVVASFAEILSLLRKDAAVLSRGYGRSSRAVMEVNAAAHGYEDVGDEPLMLSRKGIDVFVAKNRKKSAALALGKKKYEVLLLDDGLVQKDLVPHIRFVVVDAAQGLGNGEMLPLGPLRIDFPTLKNSIHAIILLTHAENQDCSAIKAKLPAKIPLMVGRLQQDISGLDSGAKYLAFCGIGYPRKFFDAINRSLFVVKEFDFPDHHPFSENDMATLLGEAENHGARLITTEKDFMRVPERFRELVTAVPVKILWHDLEKIISYLL